MKERSESRLLVYSSANPHMHHALTLAARGLGNVWPNPAVGCVIVKDGVIIGRGWTQPGGRPHAEAMALTQAGEASRGAFLYVTLEPCCQPGRGPACTDGIIAAGIKKVFIAMQDPHARVNGGGIAALRAAGIEVHVGEGEAAARELNQGFLSVVERGRPWVTLKLGTSANWKITGGAGAPQWITGEAARRHGHLLRATHDAILVGVNTVIADDPMLDCRIPGLEKFSPVRVVMDRQLRISLESKLVQSARKIPLWIFCDGAVDKKKVSELEDLGVILNRHPRESGDPGNITSKQISDVDYATWIPAFAGMTTKMGITRVLVEGGAKVAQSFLDARLVDEWVIYQSPHAVGEDGINAPRPGGQWQLKTHRLYGQDSYQEFVLKNDISSVGSVAEIASINNPDCE